jgi:hypothetical protein
MLMRVVSLGFAMLASGRGVTGSGSCISDNGYSVSGRNSTAQVDQYNFA